MSRRLSNWLESYLEYSDTGYAPPLFNLWTGLSALAAAAERKIWMEEEGYRTHPNLFVLLIAGPGVGKSSAIVRAEPIVRGIQSVNQNFKIMMGLATAGGTCDEMERPLDTFTYPNPQTQREELTTFSSLYYMGDEGSDSALKNHADDFQSVACAMYDCKSVYQKTLRSKRYHIPNPVMNLIVGSTFDFLKTVVDQKSVLGGLASRFTYVIERNGELKGGGIGNFKGKPYNPQLQSDLIEDLCDIHKFVGRFRVEKSALELNQSWWEGFKTYFDDLESEKMKSIAIRKPTLLRKVVMLLSVAERDDLGITLAHMERAIEIVEAVTKDNATVIRTAMMGNVDTQQALNQTILQVLKDNGGKASSAQIVSRLVNTGVDVSKIPHTLTAMLSGEMLRLSSGCYELLIDPDRNL